MIQLKSRIYHIKTVPLNTPVGYGPLAYTRRETRIAVIPFGFGDGIHRIIGNRCKVLVYGKKVRQIGKLCMDFCMIDVPEVQIGDTVTIIGTDGSEYISIFDMADLYPGSPCEVSTSIGSRIPRVYIKNGQFME
ncbi:alanine racemase C-terminal domain-containing protein [Dethiosulfatibacter aminovorans]|uniref:alanine racemase C-terminal domain-containing protein n=1 Tax=Dethiosulfatibacter aminovorans TaxID=332095 RepID=UPI000934799E